MMTQIEFMKTLGIGFGTLKKLQEQGLFLPVQISPTGKRIYYTEEQVEEYKKYKREEIDGFDLSESISAREFSDKTNISLSTLYSWHQNGRLKAELVTKSGILRYSLEQVDKYFAGEYAGVHEEGFIDRKSLADMIGVSEATVTSWHNKGWLHPDHRTITRKWQYRPEQVEEAKKIKEAKSCYYKNS